MVLQLVPLKTHASETKKQIIETLEDLLGRAKKGEFEGFAWTASLSDGAIKTGYTMSIDFHCLLSGVTTLQYRMLSTRRAVEDE